MPSRRTLSCPSSRRSSATAPHRGRLFVISGPSGVGKGSVVRSLLARVPELFMSVSVTTREPRSGEVDGRDYLFVDAEAFTRMVAEGRFLEWAEVFGHRYGTPLAPIETVVSAGRDAVLEIDVQGAGIVREKVPGAVLVFLVPPSREELARRLRARGTEDDPELEARLAAVDQEMSERDRFDRVVVNDDLQRAVDQVAAIILEPTSGDPERKTP